jgi:hypothetical protein
MRRHGGRSSVRSEVGETLVEVVVSTTILGIIGVGIIGAIATVLISSDVDRSLSRAETVLRSYVAAVQAADYVPCAGPGTYDPAQVGYSEPANFSVMAPKVQFVANTPPISAPVQPVDLRFSGACSGADPGLQRIDLVVESADQRATEKITIFKRDTTGTSP